MTTSIELARGRVGDASSSVPVVAMAADGRQPRSFGLGQPTTRTSRPEASSPLAALDGSASSSTDPAGIDGRSSSRTSGTSSPAVVAGNKLTVPRSRRPLVRRPELTLRLDEDYRVALVSAPAGYGKTAALASWATQHRDPVAWLSCDPADAEPARFMSCLLAAIAATWPGAADDALVLLERDGANTYDAAVAAANELASVALRGVIVVDDLHLAAPDPTMLTAFIDALPEGFRFVAGTRSDPPLSLARLRLHGDLLELRRDQLRFSTVELAEFFELCAVSLTGDQLLRLQDLTEGWPAGAQLAAIALQNDAGYDGFLSAFATTDHAVSDFLVTEVLARLPGELESFLVQTSVLDVFDADLCAAVTGSADAAALLDRLLADDLFVVPVDHRRGSYRYHRLFSSFLRARLAASGASKLREAHDRAGRILEDRGDAAGALQQAMAMHDADRAGRIVRGALSRSMTVPDSTDVAGPAIRLWLHEFGAACIETDPAWVVELLIGLMSLGGSDGAAAWLDRVRLAHPRAEGELRALIELATALHHQKRGQPLLAIGRLDVALDVLGGALPDEGLLSFLDVSMASAHLEAGDVAEGHARIERALERHDGSPASEQVHARGIAALAAAGAGELTRAHELATIVAHTAEELGLIGDETGPTLAKLALVELHLERNDHEVAARILKQIVQSGEALQRRLPLQGLVALCHAKLARLLGDETRAEAVLGQARHCYAEPDEALLQVFGEEAAAQALRFDPSHAADVIADLDQDLVATQVLRTRLALIERRDVAAAALLADLPPPTTRRTSVERSVLLALSVLARDVERANEHLREALAAGQPEGLVRTLIDQGPGTHQLLRSFGPDAAQIEYVEVLLSAVGDLPPAKVFTVQQIVEPLSTREIMVLRYLCTRLTYREMAAALFVSLNTLKSHVRSVYRKLGVGSRVEAVEAGRRCGVI